MIFHEPVRLPQGFCCLSKNCGIKDDPATQDLSLIFSEAPAAAAAVFTRNQFPGAPVILGREIVKRGILRAIVINSSISNVGTGEQGLENARRMARAVAAECGISADEVLMSSTGVIGKQLPIEKIEQGIAGCSVELSDDPLQAARGIMTTDTYPKALSLAVGPATITIIGKGAGMIEPNMATMLIYILTDAQWPASKLNAMLRQAVNQSFNMLSIDTDTSTSDTCAILANGLAGAAPAMDFASALETCCIEMTKLIARDGEGATKLLTATALHAANNAEARVIAKSLINSPLVKTMAYGADPNIGRVLMATGKCFDCRIDPDKLKILINDRLVFAGGMRVDFDEDQVRKLLGGEHVDIVVDLQAGEGWATAYGCDLTHGYIDENAAYYSS